MRENNKTKGMLSLYRALDMTDEKGLLCGKLLGDLGADVIKIERPGGDPARNIGPFYHDEVDPEKSLFWWAFNTSKRGITLDIETAEGQEVFKKLVKTADFVIESFCPGYMDRLGLDYKALEKINPGIIMVSITPFGQTGPYKDYKAPDIVAWAMGGQMYQFGDDDRAPIRISHHSQAHLHASADAAVGAMVALRHREMTGEGQHVDVSIQESVAQASYMATSAWETMKVNQRRGGLRPGSEVRMTHIWPCKDGYVIWIYWGGLQAKRWNLPLIAWMEEEGIVDNFLKGFDWDTFDWLTTTQGVVDRLVAPTVKFFMSHTKLELLNGAREHHVQLYPVSTTRDILESVQLDAREFWTKLRHPELAASIIYPGAFAHASGMPPKVLCRAPLIGEHNQQIYEMEPGLSKEVPVTPPHKAYSAESSKESNWRIRPKKPLEGIKVVGFTWALTGPITSKTLADYGAEVIKIESNSRLDIHRTLPPFKDGVPGLNRAAYFQPYNTSKLSITLNITHPRGVEVAKRLVARADIVIDNFAGGAMERMGLGYEELKKEKPDIIMLASCMQGHTGPYVAHPGTGNQLTALAGFRHIAGWPDREPAALGAYTDFIGPHFNTLTILAALDYRSRTGEGQYIDMSQYENGVHFMSPLILDYLVNGRVANRMGNSYEYAAPHGAYRCRGEDRWCAIAVFTDEEWRAFKKVIDNPAWTSDSRFDTLQARKDNEDHLDKLVEEWTINHSAEEVMAMMQEAGVAAGVLETGEDLIERDPQLGYRHFYWELDHPEIGKHHAPRPPFVLSKSPCELRRAPLLGENNEHILKEILGMSDHEIAGLVLEGVMD